ncbi:GH116 family glycosyl-hydrolase [Reichenbachiella sp. 5M10]|uniref:GH116 family glycosyl-hydrolase n=1 Tax=Reichenbachiella sp. 5M10 TaxID=1889772 RepID=UPI000C144B2E|nr:GH116 family glycosyl-hydrolase [Reichenbachiella sp. 5M10]
MQRKLGLYILSLLAVVQVQAQAVKDTEGKTHKVIQEVVRMPAEDWPVLTSYDQDHIARIAMPIGGIGTGTVSLGGRGDLRDWAIMNTGAIGYIPTSEHRGYIGPFFALFTQTADGQRATRALEGPLDVSLYEGPFGSNTPNHGFPRFDSCTFKAAYPFGQVLLSDSDMPLDVRIKAFNPYIPGDADASGIPIAVLTYELTNPTDQAVKASVSGNMPNFIGMDGADQEMKGRGFWTATGAKDNKNDFRKDNGVQGIYMRSEGVDQGDDAWGTMALTTSVDEKITYRTSWSKDEWSNARLDYWDDFSADGQLEGRSPNEEDRPMGSLAVEVNVPANSSREVTFYLTWHFPNRMSWSPLDDGIDNGLTNYYATQYADAWDVAEKVVPQIPELEGKSLQFVNAFVNSDLPDVVKESALYNSSTLRTQTCFRTADGKFFGWEGTSNVGGICHGSCTHVWNYEQATAFLFGGLSRSMREVEFGHATDDLGMLNFRVGLPLERATYFDRTAADGQMGSIMRMYRDWQLSGDDELLLKLWPNVKKAMEYCWIDGGWDADKDGVMDGCQHNTMDVQYFGPNPQMGIWYLGALRASEEMARYTGDVKFAKTCHKLFEKGSKWIDDNLFNGEYYIHLIEAPESRDDIAPSLLKGLESKDLGNPDYQLGEGCLVDQLVGQYLAHICGLGYLTDEQNVKTTLQSIMKYNYRDDSNSDFNSMRSFVLGDEKSLVMASYPGDRPKHPFPYFTEAMTGFEYTAAVGMLYEGQTEDGLLNIKNIRDRYDGLKRNPFNEAECGHNYARAMASWGAVVALSGFQYSAVDQSMAFAPFEGSMFWSNGSAWGVCTQSDSTVELSVAHGSVLLSSFSLTDETQLTFEKPLKIQAGEKAVLDIR